MKKITIALGFFVIGVLGFSQEVIATQGDYFTASNGSLSWTLGEPITETFSNGTNNLTQGFQQVEFTATLMNEITNNINIQLYPNPVANYLTINMEGITGRASFLLYNMQGKLLKTALILESASKIDFSAYAKGIYLLKIESKDSQLIKTYKIIKQ